MSISLSYSANNRYKDSPRAWYLHYMRRLRPEQTTSALVFGTAIDAALNQMIENKFNKEQKDYIKTFEVLMKKQKVNNKMVDLRTSDAIKFYKSDVLDDFFLTDEDKKLLEKYKKEWVSLRRKGLMMLKAYQEQVMPHLSELHSIQTYVNIPNNEGDKIIGFTDLIARFEINSEAENAKDLEHLSDYNGKLIIFDNKTSSIKYKEDSVRLSEQLGTYKENPKVDEEIDGEGYIVLPKKFRKQKKPMIPIQIIIDKVDPTIVESIFESYGKTIQGIKMGDFPCTQNCLKSPFGCVYEKYCKSDGKDLEGLVYVGKEKDR